MDITRYSFNVKKSNKIPVTYPKKIRLCVYPTGNNATPDRVDLLNLAVRGLERDVSFTLVPSGSSQYLVKSVNYLAKLMFEFHDYNAWLLLSIHVDLTHRSVFLMV